MSYQSSYDVFLDSLPDWSLTEPRFFAIASLSKLTLLPLRFFSSWSLLKCSFMSPSVKYTKSTAFGEGQILKINGMARTSTSRRGLTRTSFLKRARPVVNFEISFFVYFLNFEKNFQHHSKSFASDPKNHHVSFDMIFHLLQFGIFGPIVQPYNIRVVHGSLASIFLGPRNDQVSLAFRVDPIFNISFIDSQSSLSKKGEFSLLFLMIFWVFF